MGGGGGGGGATDPTLTLAAHKSRVESGLALAVSPPRRGVREAALTQMTRKFLKLQQEHRAVVEENRRLRAALVQPRTAEEAGKAPDGSPALGKLGPLLQEVHQAIHSLVRRCRGRGASGRVRV